MTRHELIDALPDGAHIPKCGRLGYPALVQAQTCLGCAARFALNTADVAGNAHSADTARLWYVRAKCHALNLAALRAGVELPDYPTMAQEADIEWDGAAPC